jgi:hypothetical protein
VRVGGGYVIEDEDSISLSAVPESLRNHVGSKVWVIGRSTAAGLTVQSYGIIFPPHSPLLPGEEGGGRS